MLSKISLPLGHQMTDNAAMEKYLLSPALDILKILITDLDTEGRYLFLNAIADQLRYPHIFLFLWSSVSVCGNRSGENSFPMPVDESVEYGGISDNVHKTLFNNLISMVYGTAPWMSRVKT
ncbi:hypothetical protein Peur_040333 [Populus x canadensis]